jgi:hypothetical protein
MGLALLSKIASLFVIMLAGFVIVKCGLLSSEDSHTLSVLSLYIICPCSIISAFQIDSTPDIRSGLMLALIAGLVIQLALVVVVTLLRKPLKLDPIEQTSIIYSNSGNLIIPLVSALLGAEWVVYTCAFTCVQIVLHWSHCKSTISQEAHIDIKKILTNVNMISVYIGLIIFIFGIKLPSFAQSAVDSLAVMIGPAAMLVTGMLIAGMDFKAIFARKRVWFIAALRLLAVPLITVSCLRIVARHSTVPNAELILLITMLATASPSGSTITQMAQVYGGDKDYACSINVVTTLLCIITMPIMVALYQM